MAEEYTIGADYSAKLENKVHDTEFLKSSDAINLNDIYDLFNVLFSTLIPFISYITILHYAHIPHVCVIHIHPSVNSKPILIE